MVALDAVRPNATMTVAVDADLLTSPSDPSAKPRRRGCDPGVAPPPINPSDRTRRGPRRRGRGGTESGWHIRSKPRAGGEKEQEQIEDGEGSRVRSEQARDLIERVDKLLPFVGDVSLATHIGLLKRDLSRCHCSSQGPPWENNYLSIVTLIESAMAQLKWKQYTRSQLEAIRNALDIGYQKVRVRFEDYEKARTLFGRNNVDATPRIDLESLKWEDISDEEG